MDNTNGQCLLVLLFFCIFCCCSAAVHDGRKHITTAAVVGTVYCDTCSHQEFSKSSYLISGASVAVQCGNPATAETIGFVKEAKTDRHGVFRVRLPANVSRHKRLIGSCSVKLIKSNAPSCDVATETTGTSAAAGPLRLSSKRNGVHVFSAGAFSFKPSKQPEHCYQKSQALEDQKIDQPAPFVRPPPRFPLRPSPSNGGVLPLPRPNPLLRRPSIIPQSPILPPVQSPPSLLAPSQQPAPILPTVQPPPTFLPPFLLQPPTSQPIFRFPAFPFPQYPLFPGVPPAVPSKIASP